MQDHTALDRADSGATTLHDVLGILRRSLALLTLLPLAAGLLVLGASYIVAPTYTATTTFIPPQQAPSGASAALAALGSLGGLAGNSVAGSSLGDRYVALLQSANVADRIIDHFALMEAYEAKLRFDARRELARNVRVSLGKKDGLITVEVDDEQPQRAAAIANRHVEELRRLTSTLALTEAQQRRAFFERLLQQSRDRLAQAQQALESTGFSPGALKAEPKAAAEAFARLRAETTAAEMRLGLLRNGLTDEAPEVRAQRGIVANLREQLAKAQQTSDSVGSADYIGAYREFKYQETLFDVYARQFELARSDESREGALIQVVDQATPPERKSKPKRAMLAVSATLAAFVLVAAGLLLRSQYRRARPLSVGANP
jgi:capsule polysaccharide export protein KpsE/RkpR